MTTDRAPKNVSVKAGGVTISAQAKGAGHDPAGLRHHALLRADRRADLRSRCGPPPGRRRLVRADHRRRADVDQRHRRPPGDGRDRDADARGAPRLASSWPWRWRSSPTARAPSASAASTVTEARDAEEAERVARAIANSPLVKTALTGRRRQLGPDRAGRRHGARRRGDAGARAALDLLRGARRETSTRPRSASRSGRGDASAHVYFSDLTHEYIHINAEYTT